MIWRVRLHSLVDSDRFQRFIVAVIVLNAITLGLETSDRMVAQFSGLLHTADSIALAIFVVELGLRLAALVPSMRGVVTALLTAVPGMASIAALLGLLTYVAAVIATQLFGAAAHERFDDLGSSLFTLFQVMTTDDWAAIARDAMAVQPLAWIFFVVYLLVSTFAVLNLFIAVVVRAMEEQIASEVKSDVAEHQRKDAMAAAAILEEVRALRAEIAELRAPSAPN